MSYLQEIFQKFRYEFGAGIKKQHTIKRILNFILIRLQLLFRRSYVSGYPYFFVIEATNICNLKCPLCPTGQAVKGRAKGKMPLVNFKKIMDEISNYTYSVRLENWGEPLLNEELFDIISYAKSKKVAVSFNTNFSLIEKDNIRKLILSGLDHIKISLDGVTQDSYSKYRVGASFDKVVDNIKLLVETRKKLKRKNPFIEIQFIVMRHNENELGQIKELSVNLGVDKLTIERLHLDMREEILRPDSYCIEKFKDWLPKDSTYSLFDYKKKNRKYSPSFCSWLWTSSVINWDGSVVPCCGIYDQCYDFGNIFNGGFKKVWNGPNYMASRRLFGQRRKSNTETVCINCFRYGVVR